MIQRRQQRLAPRSVPIGRSDGVGLFERGMQELPLLLLKTRVISGVKIRMAGGFSERAQSTYLIAYRLINEPLIKLRVKIKK